MGTVCNNQVFCRAVGIIMGIFHNNHCFYQADRPKMVIIEKELEADVTDAHPICHRVWWWIEC